MGFLRENQNQPMSYDMTGMMNDVGVSDGSGNYLAQIADTAPENNAPVSVAAGPTPKRISTLDIIGAILDEGAKFGDAAPGYQTSVDRRRTLEQEAQDRNFQQQFNQQKLTAGQLGIDGTREEMGNARADRQLTRFGQASRGLGAVFAKHGAPGVMKAFPLLAKSMGMTPQESQIFGEALQQDPEGTIQTITAATTADQAGSQPKEKIIAELLRNRDPSGALEKAYLDNLASGMTDYQSGNLDLGADKLTSAERIARIRADASVRAARIRAAAAGKGGANAKVEAANAARVQAANAAKSIVASMRDAFGRLKDSGGMNSSDQSVAGRAGAIAKENVPFLERMTSPEGFSAREDLDRLRTVGITSLLPILGSVTVGGKNFDAAKELEIWRKAIASASDYDSATRALDGIEARIAEITAAEAPPASGGGSPRPRIRLKPRSNAAPSSGRVFKYNPKTGNLE